MDVAADSRVVTDAVIALLEGAGLTVGDAEGPDVDPPYAIVYPVSDRTDGPDLGTMESPSADADRTIQVTSVGVSREQAQGLADKSAVALLGAQPVITGRAVRTRIRGAGGSGVRRDDETGGPPLFYAVNRYVISTTP